MSSRTAKRLLSELSQFESDPSESGVISLGPVSDEDLFKWSATIAGPSDTPFQGAVFEIAIDVPTTYPALPPVLGFRGKVFHPNVHFKTGEICLDVLKDQWSPVWTLASACLAVQSLLAAPEPSSPLNVDAGELKIFGGEGAEAATDAGIYGDSESIELSIVPSSQTHILNDRNDSLQEFDSYHQLTTLRGLSRANGTSRSGRLQEVRTFPRAPANYTARSNLEHTLIWHNTLILTLKSDSRGALHLDSNGHAEVHASIDDRFPRLATRLAFGDLACDPAGAGLSRPKAYGLYLQISEEHHQRMVLCLSVFLESTLSSNRASPLQQSTSLDSVRFRGGIPTSSPPTKTNFLLHPFFTSNWRRIGRQHLLEMDVSEEFVTSPPITELCVSFTSRPIEREGGVKVKDVVAAFTPEFWKGRISSSPPAVPTLADVEYLHERVQAYAYAFGISADVNHFKETMPRKRGSDPVAAKRDLLAIGEDPRFIYAAKNPAHVRGKPFRKALLAIMRQYWLYTTANISRELLVKLLDAHRKMSILPNPFVPNASDNPEDIPIEALCQMSRMMPSMMMFSGVKDAHEDICARADILERVLCKTWETTPRLY
ncbi:peroxin-4, partial [Phenoliferia sp. Uapishka_3]